MTTTDTEPSTRTITIYSVQESTRDNDNYPDSRQVGDEFHATRETAQEIVNGLNRQSLAEADKTDERDLAIWRAAVREYDALAAAGLRDMERRPKEPTNRSRTYAEQHPTYYVEDHTLIIPTGWTPDEETTP